MKFKSSVYTQVSGSVGGLTYAHNAGGLYARARSIPTDPSSAFQTAIRNALATMATRWNDVVTASQRAAWDVYGSNVPISDSFGDPRNISGIAQYCRSNALRQQIGATIIDAGPTTYTLPTFTAITIDAWTPATPSVDIAFDVNDAWVSEDEAHLAIYASRPQSPGINFFKGPFRYAGSIDGDSSTPPTSPATIPLPFAVAVGQKVFLYARLSRADGRLSSKFQLSGAVA